MNERTREPSTPLTAYLVEEIGPAGESGQIAGFTSEREAQRLQSRLRSEGRETSVNLVPVYERWEDYEADR